MSAKGMAPLVLDADSLTAGIFLVNILAKRQRKDGSQSMGMKKMTCI